MVSVAGHGAQFVSAAEITRNFGLWQDRAANGPLIVTHHGRPRCVLLAAERYDALAGATPAEDVGGGDAIESELLAQHIPAGFLVLDAQLRVTRANARAALIFGRPVDAATGLAIEDLLPTLAGSPAAARMRRTLRTGEESQVAVPIDAETELSLTVFPWPGGIAILLRTIVLREEEAEIQAAARDAALAAHGGIGMARLTVRGTISSVTDAFARMVGFAPARLAGVRAVDLMALRLRAETAEAIEATLSGRGPAALDGRLLVNGGGELPARIAFAPLAGGLATAGAEMVVTTA